MSSDLTNHTWPGNEEHVWGDWMLKTAREGVNPPTQYRKCVHPNCQATETRIAPSG